MTRKGDHEAPDINMTLLLTVGMGNPIGEKELLSFFQEEAYDGIISFKI